MDFLTASEDLVSFAVLLFGDFRVSVLRFRDPDAMEISISTQDKVAGDVKVSLYDELSLQIAGMHFEYGEYSLDAIGEVRRLLTAAKEGKLCKQKRRFLGIAVGESLQVI